MNPIAPMPKGLLFQNHGRRIAPGNQKRPKTNNYEQLIVKYTQQKESLCN